MQGKLAKRFYGPFRVVKRIGPVAYRLQLLDNARIHPVVHCSVLKPFRGSLELDEAIQLSSNFFQDQPVISPLAILDHHKSSPTGPWEVLMQWQGLSPDDTSWEDWDKLQKDYHLEDKVILQGLKGDSAVKEQVTEIGVQLARKTKRRIARPAYLKDYIWEFSINNIM